MAALQLAVSRISRVIPAKAELVCAAFAEMEAGPDAYVSLRRSIAAAKKGNYVFHYGAPVLIVTANRRDYGNALADSACVLENMMIAANALDLGSCWINQLHWLDGHPGIRAYLEGLGLGAEETVTGGLILGYAAEGLPARTPLERTGNPVTWVGTAEGGALSQRCPRLPSGGAGPPRADRHGRHRRQPRPGGRRREAPARSPGGGSPG